jgi:hypothetical protein
LAATLAISIGTNTLNPQLALNPMPIAIAVIISFSIGKNQFLKIKQNN